MTAVEDGKAWIDVPVRFSSVPWAKDCAPDNWLDRLNRINAKVSQLKQGDPAPPGDQSGIAHLPMGGNGITSSLSSNGS